MWVIDIDQNLAAWAIIVVATMLWLVIPESKNGDDEED